jgi:hypothetical protein
MTPEALTSGASSASNSFSQWVIPVPTSWMNGVPYAFTLMKAAKLSFPGCGPVR